MRLVPTPWIAGMLSSITSTCVGTPQAPRSSARLYAAAASRTRRATAAITGVSFGATRRERSSTCALITTFIGPWRYKSTSRERCRATGLKPIASSTWPSACGRLVAYSTNSMPSSPNGLATSAIASRSIVCVMACSFSLASSARHDAACGQHLARDVGSVGDQPVDAEIEHALHRRRIVDRPHQHLQPERLRLLDPGGIDVAEVHRPVLPAGRLDHARHRA